VAQLATMPTGTGSGSSTSQMGMSLGVVVWNANSRATSGLRHASIHALIRAALRASLILRAPGFTSLFLAQQHEADNERADAPSAE
jgi:hypothetical protein